ncbi:MAG: recombination regulator RecX, partial [Actinomycetota bacterium]|nr:recombination regulator RecX [Actinomycetota bacterium]
MCALPSGPDPGGARPAAADPDPKADPESVARALALRRLNAQPRTRAELEQTLAQRSVPPEVAAGVLDRLEQVGLVDDAAFARSWVESRQAGRG